MLLRAALLAHFLALPVSALAEPPIVATLRGDGVTLPPGSEIWFSPRFPISGEKLRIGDRFELAVTRDVTLGCLVVVPRGAVGHARVVKQTSKGAFGRSGKLDFDIVDVELDGGLFRMTGHFRIEGKGNTDVTVITLAAIGAIGAAFVTGHSAALSNGVELPGSTAEAVPTVSRAC